MDELSDREAQLIEELEDAERQLRNCRRALAIVLLVVYAWLWRDELAALLIKMGAKVDG